MKTLAYIFAFGAIAASAQAAQSLHTGLELNGRGSQIYSCQETANGYAWILKGPDAKLYDASGQVVGRHFFGPEWEANDGSSIKGKVLVSSASPDGSANASWLILQVQVAQKNGLFGDISMVTRTDTQGGGMPSAPCGPQQKGKTFNVPYSARYTFFPTAKRAQN
jgi:Protein of unknown function (DUF3455)